MTILCIQWSGSERERKRERVITLASIGGRGDETGMTKTAAGCGQATGRARDSDSEDAPNSVGSAAFC
jgi:hypothetical protein